MGKMAVEHIPIIKELQYRNVLSAAPIETALHAATGVTGKIAEASRRKGFPCRSGQRFIT